MQYSKLDFNPEFQIQFRMYFHTNNLKNERKTHDFLQPQFIVADRR